jgi:hypothetical protein
MFRGIKRIVGYLWAAPMTLLGLTLVPLAWCSGGKARIVAGVIEVHGGLITLLMSGRIPLLGPALARTIGHVILGRDEAALDDCRVHEHVHVRQFERWGVLLFPLYLAASAVLYARGRDPYLDNPFEREAMAADRRAA